ncbi:hypothetical protein B0T26DRAFT_733751 [Lasiosphaeria miniovina]|uniref:Uncharacterized protein n=1 Tax=Lasiosphaeria miniovina TaxID=1954250 RepID=A0AA39ZUZ6_9PEZI|nr:uncharacterized protein B0T26DRAFT_733751 [Lasiosphaeria miniovina]KAK0704052.1 hypothetical protein B0T26DRAFT_733751 [Lasiosphaeria miniovina]
MLFTSIETGHLRSRLWNRLVQFWVVLFDLCGSSRLQSSAMAVKLHGKAGCCQAATVLANLGTYIYLKLRSSWCDRDLLLQTDLTGPRFLSRHGSPR